MTYVIKKETKRGTNSLNVLQHAGRMHEGKEKGYQIAEFLIVKCFFRLAVSLAGMINLEFGRKDA